MHRQINSVQLLMKKLNKQCGFLLQPSVDLKQALLGGTSVFVLTTLHTGICTLEAAECKVESLVKECHVTCQVRILVRFGISNIYVVYLTLFIKVSEQRP